MEIPARSPVNPNALSEFKPVFTDKQEVEESSYSQFVPAFALAFFSDMAFGKRNVAFLWSFSASVLVIDTLCSYFPRLFPFSNKLQELAPNLCAQVKANNSVASAVAALGLFSYLHFGSRWGYSAPDPILVLALTVTGRFVLPFLFTQGRFIAAFLSSQPKQEIIVEAEEVLEGEEQVEFDDAEDMEEPSETEPLGALQEPIQQAPAPTSVDPRHPHKPSVVLRRQPRPQAGQLGRQNPKTREAEPATVPLGARPTVRGRARAPKRDLPRPQHQGKPSQQVDGS